MELLMQKFKGGMTTAEFEGTLGENRQLHEHHYDRNDVSQYRQEIASLPQLRIIILTEPWCGDSLAIVPTILKLFEGFDNVQIRFVPRDENPDLMDHYLTRSGRAIPKIIVMDENFNELFNWGPRPGVAQQIFETYRDDIAAGNVEKKDVIKKIRAFYSKDKGQVILKDFTDKLHESLKH
jgi:hypothetical protein